MKISQLMSLQCSLVYASNVNYRWSIGRLWTVYNLHRDVSVFEAMVPFKGRSTLKQYMPMKPVICGFKVWMLADAHMGYDLVLKSTLGYG